MPGLLLTLLSFVVELALERPKPIAELAKDLRISESCLRNWLAQADVDENGSQTHLTSAQKKELADVRVSSQGDIELGAGKPFAGQLRVS